MYYRRDGSCVEEVFTAKETSDVVLEARWEKKEEITPAPTNTPVVSGPPVDTKEPTETEEPVPNRVSRANINRAGGADKAGSIRKTGRNHLKSVGNNSGEKYAVSQSDSSSQIHCDHLFRCGKK